MFVSSLIGRQILVRRADKLRGRRRNARPLFELMEPRCVPAVIMVSSLADGPATAPVTAVGQAFSAPSLRAAITFANSSPAADTIDLTAPGVYAISLRNATAAGEDQNQTGDFDILASGGDLTIQNTSGAPVTVSGSGLDRVFDINPNLNFDPNNATPKFTVTLQGFTITNGLAFSTNFTDGNGNPGSGNNPTDVSGGGIRDNFNASLTLQDINLSGNTAQAAGGGVSMENRGGFSTPWTLKVENSTISNNRAGDAGGGINTVGNGRVIVNQSVVSYNVCVNQGAGIWLDTNDVMVGETHMVVHQSSVLTVTQSEIIGNVGLATGSFGGGIGNAGNDMLATGQAPLAGEVQAVSIINSTVADNATGGEGGGYGDEGGQGTLFVQNSTISNNSANLGGGVQATGPSTTILDSTITGNSSQTDGGGVVVDSPLFTLDNTIVAQNYAGATNFVGNMAPDIMAAVTSGIGNFIGIADTNLTGLSAGTNQIGSAAAPLQALLGPLQTNGGPLAGAPSFVQTVPTEAPLTNSPVIDRGSNLVALPATDERGLVRVINNTVDVGAVEFQPPATTTVLTVSGTVVYGKPLTFSATVTPQVTGDPLTGTVTFSLDGVSLGTVTVTNGGAAITITPTVATLKPGNHSVTAAYSGDANFTSSTATQTLVAPALPALTTTLARKRNRFTLKVRNNGQQFQQFTFGAQPVVQQRDFDGDGINDLVINVKKGKQLVVFAVFSGVTAQRIK